MIRKEPADWEALYRRGEALAGVGKREAAERAFRTLLDLTLADDEKSAIVKARTRDPKLQGAGARQSSIYRKATVPLEDRIGQIYEIRMACELDGRAYYSSSGPVSAWAPQDIGQARMSALGWLVSLAQKRGTARAEEVIAAFRKASERSPANLRALWDWFYLCVMRYDNAGAFAAARSLSRAAPTDPLALWAYLYALGGRQLGTGMRYYANASRDTSRSDHTPPLDNDELKHVLACYQALRTRRPELAQAQILQNVADELRRAKQTDEGERFYRDAIAGSAQLAQIAGAFSLAARRGDVEGLIQLLDRYERLQAGRTFSYYYTGSYYFGGPGPALSQGMSACAERKSYGDILKLLDYDLAMLRRRQEHQSPGAAARANRARIASYGPGYVPRYQIWIGKNYRYLPVDFPLPNEYLDETAIQALRTAFEHYRIDDVLSDLVGHFRSQAEAAATPADALYPRLCLSYILWWNDDKDEAIAEFKRVAEASRANSDLRIELAELLEQQGERDDALVLADAVQPMDNSTMKRREELAMRVSVLTGNMDRARQAAERLFGLRLDTDTQVRLAGQMHQLGLHELAEAVLGRARRRAGNKAAALVALMLQYQRQDKLDVAVQVAMQILRSTSAARQTNPNVSNVDEPDAARTAAIGVLSRSGRLGQLIDKANTQLEKSPGAIQLHQALADYYKASGRRDDARRELGKIVEIRPDDLSLRFQVAQQLVQDGQAESALEHYKVILAKDPAIVARYFYQVIRAFQQAKQIEQLLGLIEQVDLRQLGDSYYLIQLLGNVLDDDKLHDRAMPLLRRVWDAFPEEHSYLFSYLRNEKIWKNPEIYEFARDSVVPRPESFSAPLQWELFDAVLSNAPDGRMSTVVSRILDLATAQGRLEELSSQVDTLRKSLPDWIAGDVIRATIDCRLGRFDLAREMVRRFLEETKDQPLSTNVFGTLGGELEDYAPTRDLALDLYETSIYRTANDPYYRLNLNHAPALRLVTIYAHEDRRDDARRVLVDFTRYEDSANLYNVEYIQQMKLRALAAVGDKLTELDFAVDAVSIFGQALALEREIPLSSPNYIGDREAVVLRCREGLNRVLAGLKKVDLTGSLRRMIAVENAGAVLPEARRVADQERGVRKVRKTGPAVDLMVLVHPLELDKAEVRSLLAEAIAGPEGAPLAPDRLQELEALIQPLEALRKAHPEDFSVAIAEVLVVMGIGDSKRIEAALDRLVSLVDKTPLEPMLEGARANSRQRAQAGQQLPLWVVARACATHGDAARLTAVAEKLEAQRRRGGSQTVRQPRPDGHAPRARRPGPGRRRPTRRRGRLDPDARDPHRAPRPQGRESPDAESPGDSGGPQTGGSTPRHFNGAGAQPIPSSLLKVGVRRSWTLLRWRPCAVRANWASAIQHSTFNIQATSPGSSGILDS